jgi:probable HAF family extracellular repeat protein
LSHGKKGNTNQNQKKEREKKMKKLSLALIGLMASFAISVSTSRGQIFYTLEDLGVVKDMDSSVPAAINNQAQVAGTAYKGEQTCAFHYDYVQKFMADAGGVNSRGFGINATDLVVGDAFFEGMGPILASHAVLFKGGLVFDLGVLKGQVYSRANGINALGQVVGFSGPTRDSNNSRAFMWTSQSGMIDIGTLGGAYAQANAVNDTGFVTGAAQVAGWGPMLTTHAFLYQPLSPSMSPINRPMRDLGVLGSGLSSYGMAINNYNHVVGYSTLKPNDERVHAFFHDGKSMIDLGSLGGIGNRWGSDNSVALGINSFDQVVGYTYLPMVGEMPIQQVAFLWRRGQMINLNNLLARSQRNYLLTSATAINDNGQIVASAYDLDSGAVHAVLLTPNGPTH